MKPPLTKKYIFKRKLDGKPIVIDLFEPENRREYFESTRKMFFDLGIHVYLVDDPDYAWMTTHEIHVVLPKSGAPHTMVIQKGAKFEHRDQYETQTND